MSNANPVLALVMVMCLVTEKIAGLQRTAGEKFPMDAAAAAALAEEGKVDILKTPVPAETVDASVDGEAVEQVADTPLQPPAAPAGQAGADQDFDLNAERF